MPLQKRLEESLVQGALSKSKLTANKLHSKSVAKHMEFLKGLVEGYKLEKKIKFVITFM